mmetsp:Transcript_62300/g.94082  ORF Transcript_62300/g.94082 Transcript_62300/m.94082 type:complete len:222 (-) Transcript_62300:1581-2246(-)
MSKAMPTTSSLLSMLIALVTAIGASFASIPSSYAPLAQAFPILPTARTVADRHSIPRLRSSIGLGVRPFSRTSDIKAGRQLPLAISRAASRQAPSPSTSRSHSYKGGRVTLPPGLVRSGSTRDATKSHPIAARVLSADRSSCDTDEPQPPLPVIARTISPSFLFVLPREPPVISERAVIASSMDRVDNKIDPSAPVAWARVSESSAPIRLHRIIIPPLETN